MLNLMKYVCNGYPHIIMEINNMNMKHYLPVYQYEYRMLNIIDCAPLMVLIASFVCNLYISCANISSIIVFQSQP